jgi:uncharacterized protein with HEPN domain
MSRPDAARLEDIASAIVSIRSHLEHGPISVEIVMDAVAIRLLEIGEAAKGLSPEVTAAEPDVDWRGVAGMRDFLAHHCFATRPDVIQLTLDKRLPLLGDAVRRLQARLDPGAESAARSSGAATK